MLPSKLSESTKPRRNQGKPSNMNQLPWVSVKQLQHLRSRVADVACKPKSRTKRSFWNMMNKRTNMPGFGRIYFGRKWSPQEKQISLKPIQSQYILEEIKILQSFKHQSLVKLLYASVRVGNDWKTIFELPDSGLSLQEAMLLQRTNKERWDQTWAYVIEERLPFPTSFLLVYQKHSEETLNDRILLKQPKHTYPGQHLQETLPLMLSAAKAIHLLHQNNIMHRDIKPPNIIVKNKSQVVIIDFECSLKYGSIRKEKLQKHTYCGTQKYYAPQMLLAQIEGQGNYPSYNYKLDIWCLGITFYEVLYRVLPWDYKPNIDPAEYLQKITNAINCEYVQAFLSTTTNEFPPQKRIKALILNMLRQKPADRVELPRVIEELESLMQPIYIEIE